MLAALDAGKVARYVTDFPNDVIAGHDKVVTLPHLGASTEESEDNCAIMAVKQTMDFIENGNIQNSVNYPACDAGKCTAASRLTVCHKNIPNMISQFTSVLAKDGVNISDMTDKSRGDFAYTLMDVETTVSEAVVSEIEGIDGVIKVRVIK